MIFAQIIIFMLVLSFLVVIHELGHYLTARFFKVRVQEFGVGYPPRALKLFTRGKTLFTLNWIPFGGFVKMEGEEGPASTEEEELDESASKSKEGPFYSKSKRARLIIILAGALINFAFGVLAFSLFFSFTGIPELASNPRIGAVTEGLPAAVAGIPANVDVIAVKVKDQVLATKTIDEVVEAISSRPGEQITVITTGACVADACQETAQEFPLTVRPKTTQAEGDIPRGEIGIRFEPVVVQRFFPWYEMPFRGAWFGLKQAFFLSKLILESLGGIGQTLIKGQVPQEVGSPVKIFVEGRKAGIFSQGPWVLLNFAGIISINLAIFNVLPIPALDGGRAVLILLESLVGKKRINKVEGYLNYGGIVFLLGLMIMVLAKDVIELAFK